jgi:urease subunit gamma
MEEFMNLTPREKDKLMIALAALVARGRLARGVKLNYPESVALITDFVMEGARDVRADGRLLTCEPAKVLSMAQRVFWVPVMV